MLTGSPPISTSLVGGAVRNDCRNAKKTRDGKSQMDMQQCLKSPPPNINHISKIAYNVLAFACLNSSEVDLVLFQWIAGNTVGTMATAAVGIGVMTVAAVILLFVVVKRRRKITRMR